MDVAGLAMPFFGLIALGFVCGRLFDASQEGLAWLNIYIVFVAVPALYFVLISRTPFEELANVGFVAVTTTATFACFALSLGIGLFASRGDLGQATIQGAAGSYSNVGYMGPGLTLAALGPAAAAPTALVFVFDCMLLFTLVPFLMSIAGSRKESVWSTAGLVVRRIALHPFNIATLIGGVAAYFHWIPPAPVLKIVELLSGSAAPCALFMLGVTVALQPLKKVPRELPALLTVKLLLHPAIVFALLSAVGGFDPVWIATAVLMASLPPALNVFVMASQYQTYVERASAIILVGTVVSVASVTTLLALVVHSGIR
ncbi:AEC family transporter [Chelatococcus sambhunathii]|uniref:AEC family transporter n=1 Tax=Chelatococcus sambhunathii TaxID=363953 RepID=A0ABU1DB28_9HYPH|nr:AEC family transporter [Chelatococcus sambhunathii]MDR4305135.1 AEC family transporter [Chelatococcus sambhunathii]